MSIGTDHGVSEVTMARHADSIGTRTCRPVHSQGRHRALPVLVVVLGLGGGPDHAAAQASWRGLVVAPEARCAPYDAAAYRYPQSVEARDRRRPGRRVRALHRPLVRESARHRHRTHRGPVRGPRQRVVCGGCCAPETLCVRPPEPDPGESRREPHPEGRQRRRPGYFVHPRRMRPAYAALR